MTVNVDSVNGCVIGVTDSLHVTWMLRVTQYLKLMAYQILANFTK